MRIGAIATALVSSILLATLAFGEGDILARAKIGILAASLLAGIGGWLILRGGRAEPPPEAE